MDLLDVKIDEEMGDEGAWVQFDDTTAMRIASSTSKRFEQAAIDARRPHRNLLGAGVELSADVREQIEVHTISSLILDWRGLTENGKPLEFSPETAHRIMKEYKALRLAVAREADRVQNFQRHRVGENGKNS